MSTLTVPDKVPALVAHRGYALHYPENTLEAIEAALKAGASHVEFDVQLSSDEEPVVIHDSSLQRTAGIEGMVFDLSGEELSRLEVNESSRLGNSFEGIRLPTLAQMVRLLEAWPLAHAFVELKRASLKRFGTETMVQRVRETLKPIAERCTIISFSAEGVLEARNQGATSVGWVVESLDEEAYCTATEMAPDYLFFDQEDLSPGSELWPGPWQWALYEVTDADLALALAARGADLIETMAIAELLDDPRLRPKEPA